MRWTSLSPLTSFADLAPPIVFKTRKNVKNARYAIRGRVKLRPQINLFSSSKLSFAPPLCILMDRQAVSRILVERLAR